MDQQQRSYTILAQVQAGIGALLALGVFALYALRPSFLSDPTPGLVVAALGVVGTLYYFGLHWWLRRRYLAISTLVLTLITGSNLIFIIAMTGGLDSPYYAFWLLAIITAGIFGTIDTLVILGLTTVYYLFSLYQHGFSGQYTSSHIAQLLLSLIAGGLSEWVYWRTRRMGTQTVKMASLNGKLTEEQLKAQVLMSAMAEGVIVVDTAHRIQLFNPAAQTLTGWDEQSAQNIDYSTVLNLHTGDDQVLTPETDPLARALKGQINTTADNLVMTTRAGRKVPLYVSISPIMADKELTGAIALFRDISKEKEVERQKDEFVSTASHEMRTPVAAIEGYISLAMNANVSTIDDRASGYLTKAHDAIAHLGELFRDLLSVTKAEEGKVSGPLVPTNLTELIKAAVDDMQFTAKQKGLDLIFQPTAGGKSVSPIFWAMANPERLREVVMNLIDNAIKFTERGGVTITLTGDAKTITTAITDTGIGIPTEDVSHLFQKFYRVDNSATRTIGGTGLGLYLTRTLIELFNGRIWVESAFGKGSIFSFSLPRISQEEAERRQKEAANQILPASDTPPAPAPVPVAPRPISSPTAPQMAKPPSQPVPVSVTTTPPT